MTDARNTTESLSLAPVTKASSGRSSAFRANAQAMRKRMTEERLVREAKTRRRKPEDDLPQNPNQARPFAEASYAVTLAMRGSHEWYSALCRRLAVLEDTSTSRLIDNPQTVIALAKRYENCFQRGIVRAVRDYIQPLDQT